MIYFTYMNHRGQVEQRKVGPPYELEMGYRPGHGYQPGWFLSAIDHTRADRKPCRRSFALANFRFPDLDARYPSYPPTIFETVAVFTADASDSVLRPLVDGINSLISHHRDEGRKHTTAASELGDTHPEDDGGEMTMHKLEAELHSDFVRELETILNRAASVAGSKVINRLGSDEK